MNTQIFYFTGTGNSLTIAKELQKLLDEPVELLPIKKKLHHDLHASAFGFIFPVYFFDIPDFVADFINKHSFPPDAYYFSVATCNGAPGRTLNSVSKLFHKKQLPLNLNISLDMPGNALVSTSDTNQARLAAVSSRIHELHAYIRARQSIPDNSVSTCTTNWISRFMKLYGNCYEFHPSKFQVSEACVNCGICSQVCPVQNITNDKPRPQWSDHCIHCLACFHWCPKEAISMNNTVVGKRFKYHHPDVKLKDII